MVIKKGTIVVIPYHKKIVGQVTYVRPLGAPGRYVIRYLSKGDIGCATVLDANEFKVAPLSVKKKYTLRRIKELFGVCYKNGCTDDCSHFTGWKTSDE